MRWYNDFIGMDQSNTIVPFLGGDFEETFQKNLLSVPADWYYHDVPITYQFNNLGHRSKNIDEIDLDNYILFTGCSHTTGIGLELEKTYPDIVSKKLGCDYYNMSMPGTGIDVLEYNLLTWFAKVKKIPKIVCVQWPDHSRYMSYHPEHEHMIERGTWDTQKDNIALVVNCEDSGLFYTRKRLAVNLINNVVNCPIISFNFGSQQQYDLENFTMRRIDLARDLAHAGIKSNEIFANNIYKKMSAILHPQDK
jgi:hypothetical protein